jgi:16S rRNA (guanine966-N2)-methyltransferase
MDPPYGKGMIPPILEIIDQNDLLTKDAIIIAESSKNDKIFFSSLKLLIGLDSRIYGETKIDIFSRR